MMKALFLEKDVVDISHERDGIGKDNHYGKGNKNDEKSSKKK